MAVVRLSDVIVPEVFNDYAQLLTMQLSALMASGAVMLDPLLSAMMAGGGLTFNQPYFNDLANDEEDVANDDPAIQNTPGKITSTLELQVRLSRAKSWSSMDLAGQLAGTDPAMAIAELIAGYWARRQQAAFIATMKGVFADNAAAPVATEHVADDLTVDIKGVAYSAGVTDFSAKAFIASTGTLGDAMGELALIMVHSIVYQQMLTNSLIQFIPDAINPTAKEIPMFLGRRVIVDDSMPNTGGVFESWLFGTGAIRFGNGTPKVASEVFRNPAAGNGSGQDTLFSRVEWILHPVGHRYAGTAPMGGPSNAATSNNLAHADSWKRAFPERKQIKIARLITRQY